MKTGLEIAQDEMNKACDNFKLMTPASIKRDIELEDSVLKKEIWNAAIEAAAQVTARKLTNEQILDEIRKLKK